MSKATRSRSSESCCVRREEVCGHTRLDIPHGLLSASNVTAGEGFWIPLTNVLGRLPRRIVSLDDARGNSKVGRLLSGGLAKAGCIPLD